MGLIPGCRYLKVNLKAKMYICVNSTTQGCPNKIITIFLKEDFTHLPPVSTTPVVNLELRISPRIFEKIETVLMWYSGAGGKLIDEKNQKRKISWHCPFNDDVTVYSSARLVPSCPHTPNHPFLFAYIWIAGGKEFCPVFVASRVRGGWGDQNPGMRWMDEEICKCIFFSHRNFLFR